MVLRELGRMERSRAQTSRDANSLNIVSYSKVRGPLRPDVLEKALTLVTHQFPLLNAHILERGNKLYFVKDPAQSLPLEVISLASEANWFKVYQSCLNQPLRSHPCLSRFALLKTPDPQLHYLIITTHHSISDGLSSGPLHGKIINLCNELLSNEASQAESSRYEPPLQPSIFPPIEAMFPEDFRGWRGWLKCGELLIQLLRNRRKFSLSTLPLAHDVPVQSRQTRVIQHRILGPEAIALTQACKAHQVTLNSTLTAAMLIAAARQICEAPKKSVRLVTQLAVDLRRYLLTPGVKKLTKANRIPAQQLIDCAGGVLQSHEVNPHSDLWELAAQIRDRLRQSVRDREMLSYTWLYGALSQVKFAPSGPSNVVVSSSYLGQQQLSVKPSSSGQVLFQIEDYSGAPSVTGFAGSFMVLASQYGQELTLNFLFAEPALSEAVMQSLIEETLSQLRRVALGSRPISAAPTQNQLETNA